MFWYLVQGSADLVCAGQCVAMPLMEDYLRPAWLDTVTQGWDLIEFLCGLATDHWHWPQLGPADGWAEIRRDNGGEERRGLSWSTLNHSDIQYPALGHNNYRMKEGRRLRDPQQCQAPRHPGRLVIAITYLLLPTNAMKWSWYLQYCSHPDRHWVNWYDIYYVHSRCFITVIILCVSRYHHVWYIGMDPCPGQWTGPIMFEWQLMKPL